MRLVSNLLQPENLDMAFARFRDTYPAMRRQGGFAAISAYHTAIVGGATVEQLQQAVEQHCRSLEWKRGYVPKMLTWLAEERWRQELPETAAPVAETAKPLPAWAQRGLQARRGSDVK